MRALAVIVLVVAVAGTLWVAAEMLRPPAPPPPPPSQPQAAEPAWKQPVGYGLIGLGALLGGPVGGAAGSTAAWAVGRYA